MPPKFETFTFEFDTLDCALLVGSLYCKLNQIIPITDTLKDIRETKSITPEERKSLPITLKDLSIEELTEQVDAWISYVQQVEYLIKVIEEKTGQKCSLNPLDKSEFTEKAG